MPTAGERGTGISVTDRAILRDGTGWVPVSGELHYSRIPRERWAERLRQLRAGGVSVASSYVFWLHHVPRRGRPDFGGNLDVGAFIDECADAGLDVALRIGPWVHAEARNGGFPDWVQHAEVVQRSDDPHYLDLVREWFGQLAAALDGRAQPGGPVIAIQLENELYDKPEHLLTLKRLAREAGIAAPLWTATAWGGAQLPADEVFPLWGGYADGFWVDPGLEWQPSFRAHYFPSHEWDDPGVGADVRAAQGFGDTVTRSHPGFPPATCELGSGMAAAYHRRPVLTGRDIAALAHGKIGNGSAWQGYYMFAGGANPGIHLQESQATGYPNDLPSIGYDFHAPIGQAGDLAESARLLRAQHAFLEAFGPLLADMTSSLPDERPAGLDDSTTLRWALRSDGTCGFVMISHHQPYRQVKDVPQVRLCVELESTTTTFPPVTIPAGTLARWPVRLPVDRAIVDWATASALTVLPGARPTVVLIEDAGVPARLSVNGVERTVAPGREPAACGSIDVLVLPHDADVWVQTQESGTRRLFLSAAELVWGRDGTVHARGGGTVEVYEEGGWRILHDGVVAAPVDLAPVPVRSAGTVPADYGFVEGRHTAPDASVFDALAAVWTLTIPATALDDDAVLDIDWAGDAAQLRVGDRLVDDRFWDGTRWSVALRDVGVQPGDAVTLHILPLSLDSTITLPVAAASRRDASPLMALDRTVLRSRGRWHPVPTG